MNNKKLREVVGRQPLFFKPNTAFVKWLIKYAGDRIILDIGCGEDFMLTNAVSV